MSDKAATAKVQITIGSLNFSAEGEQEWLASQLAMVIEAANAKGLAHAAPAVANSDALTCQSEFSVSLATYIREKKADSNQNQRFLATARWLQHRGSMELTTSAVTKALTENQQKRLANASECLNQNTKKGFCEKSGKGFYITPEGLKHLGEG
ncbi:MAG: hypothetical protein FD139_955 [Methylocystaceae bacterium]|nr:MAG: hypothetical protein FD148_1210 [Methylocystaceae bacterium]KAF0210873.1 MAG: hypothetical protein FD172_2351 [Methylocystaceae bacterium]TXT46505.1 MAG: hypothetical protein FD139_955 [Methylocystaceae bacterium]